MNRDGTCRGFGERQALDKEHTIMANGLWLRCRGCKKKFAKPNYKRQRCDGCEAKRFVPKEKT